MKIDHFRDTARFPLDEPGPVGVPMANPMVYPPENVMNKLFVLEAMPPAADRMRTRVWSRIKNGQ